MALIKCPHCAKPISDKAVKCPHCKKDVTFDTDSLKDKSSDNTNHSSSCFIAIIIILVAVCIGYYFRLLLYDFNDNQGTPTDDNTEAVVETVETTEAVDTLAVSDEVENPSEFVTSDLSAFLLHGKVKSVEESAGGQVSCTYYFSEQGELTKAVISEGDYKCKIQRQTNQLILIFVNPNDEYDNWGHVYTIDNSGRLISYTEVSKDCEDETTYSNFDTNDWPTRSKTIYESGGAVTIMTMSYSKIDEYGNWTLQTSTDNNGFEKTIYRFIEYYKQ